MMNDLNDPILTVSNLSTGLRINNQIFNVVENISFSLLPGKTLALVGESGCGKTMTALSILRILPYPSALHPIGEILYKNKNLLTLPEKEMRKIRGSRIAMIFQDPSNALNPVFTIGFQLAEIAEVHLGLYGEDALEKAAKTLAEVGFPSPREHLNDYPHQLSGGMKQRVMIAMALMCEPDILIADEPTTALDVTIQAQVLQLMRDLQKRMGMAILLITHDMGVVAEMADDVIVMYASQAVEKGNVLQIFDHMAHPYTIGLFHSRPDPTKDRKKLLAIPGSVPPLTRYPTGCRFHPRCPFMMPKCCEGEVPDFLVSEKFNSTLHKAKCWLHDGSVESKEVWEKKRKFHE